MRIIFKYNQEKDIQCLLKYGKGVTFYPTPTKEYEQFVKDFGKEATENEAKIFIKKLIIDNNINIDEIVLKYQNEWGEIADEFYKIAERIFDISLSSDITAYLTINDRCPYSIGNNYFFVRVQKKLWVKKTTMHEMWHFYTWYKFGITWEEKIGKEKYNDIKEALTVLLNVECKNLLPKDINDEGYIQHKELREKIIELWKETKNIDIIWNSLVQLIK
jgi:hypothetical protein